jgi:hypothetical protein
VTFEIGQDQWYFCSFARYKRPSRPPILEPNQLTTSACCAYLVIRPLALSYVPTAANSILNSTLRSLHLALKSLPKPAQASAGNAL